MGELWAGEKACRGDTKILIFTNHNTYFFAERALAAQTPIRREFSYLRTNKYHSNTYCKAFVAWMIMIRLVIGIETSNGHCLHLMFSFIFAMRVWYSWIIRRLTKIALRSINKYVYYFKEIIMFIHYCPPLSHTMSNVRVDLPWRTLSIILCRHNIWHRRSS